MAPLTWRNVDAPNMSGSAALMESAQNSFTNAMDLLTKNADRAAAQRRQTASQQALAGLAGIQNPNEVANYISGLDASQLSPEALEVMMRQPEVLLDRQRQQLGLDEIRGDIGWKENSREGILNSAAARLEARRQAGAEGDLRQAYDTLSGLSGHALLAALQDTGGLESSTADWQSRRGTETAYNDNRHKLAVSNSARDYVYGNLYQNANNAEEAKLRARQEIDDPELLQTVESMIDGSGDERFQIRDENIEDVFKSDASMSELANRITNDHDTINLDITNRIQSNPLTSFAAAKATFEGLLEDGSPGDIAAALEKSGISSAGIGWDGINQDFDDIIQELGKTGIKVDRKDVAVASMETARTSGIAFNDNLKNNKKAIADLLRSTKDFSAMRLANNDLQQFESFNSILENNAAEIENLRTRHHVEMSKGQTDRADRTKAAIEELLQESRSKIEDYIDKRTKSNDEPEEGNTDSSGRESSPRVGVGPDMNTYNQALQNAAANAAKIRNSRAEYERNRQPVAIPLPYGGVSMEYPPIDSGVSVGVPTPAVPNLVNDLLRRWGQ